ncbi:hypothetical protein K501DRAFT_254598 [Backusella circina FSU 941]|nr:hypothetical protein K501DRAFT_254598 [Backusella circina FSU 941]
MATLERPKPLASSAISFEEEPEDVEDICSIESNVKEEEAILVELSNEPVEYEDNNTLADAPIIEDKPIENCLSPEVVQSLHSVKYVCLNVLDTLLQQVVKDLPIPQKERRLSDSSVDGSNNLLGSITQNTNLLLLANTSQPTTTMIRSHSTPSTSISHVHRVLDSSQELLFNAGHDYTLCCSLATLLSDVYRILELCQQQQESLEENVIVAEQKYRNASLENLFDTITHLRHERTAGLTKLLISNASQKVINLWNEMDQLMDIVSRLAIQQQPPTYSELHSNNTLPPPAYDLQKEKRQSMSDEKKASCPKSDLNELISAIDHLATVAPRLNNQRAALTERQVNELAASTLGKTVERLSRGRLEEQRAPLPAVISKHEMLHGLIHQIHTSASRSLDNQRVVPSVELQRKIDLASIHGLLDRLDRGRLMNQDSLSPEQLRLNDLMQTRDLLVKSLNRPAYHRQRYSMPANTKESHLLTNGLFCTERVECDQSKPTMDHNNTNSEDLHQLLDHVYKSKPQFDNQRAAFNVDLQ